MQLKKIKLTLSLSAALVLVQISGLLSFSDSHGSDGPLEMRLVEPIHYFTNNLFRQVRQEKENVIISPISIHSALNMVLLGAKYGSPTEKELVEVLGYSKTLNGTITEAHQSYSKLLAEFKQLNEAAISANKRVKSSRSRSMDDKYTDLDVWNMAIVKGTSVISANYLDDVHRYYYSSIESISDDKPQEKQKLIENINKWAKQAGYEKSVIMRSALDERFSILLLSAIQVQGYWFDEFSEHQVGEAFYNHGISNKGAKSAKCLSNHDLRSGRYLEFTPKQPSSLLQANLTPQELRAIEELSGPTFRAVDLHLKDKLSFTIFEPLTNGTGKELASLEDHLLAMDSNGKQTRLQRALKLLDNKEFDDFIQYIQFPKFKFESDFDLEGSLKSIGLGKIFGNEAELSRMSQTPVYVSKVKHQAVIDVTKLGIKAAGLTTVKIVPLMYIEPKYPLRLLIRNPFMFVLRYDRVPLFIGHLVHM